ncbi:Iron-binding protein IscA [Thalassocella blandensis]|nr:Iron-binding protein IscA [Thalassocella blandensis]
MSVETFEINQVVSVSSAAAEHFQKQLKKTGLQAIRLSLKVSGCTGYKYVIDEVAEGAADDIQVALDNGVKLYIDPDNLDALRGMEIDYIQEGLNKNLVLNNPNVTNACGCGESFSVE